MKLMDNKLLLNLELYPTLEWMWCHRAFYVRQGWNARAIFSLQINMRVSRKVRSKCLCAVHVQTHYAVTYISKWDTLCVHPMGTDRFLNQISMFWLRNHWFWNNDQPKINFSTTIQPKNQPTVNLISTIFQHCHFNFTLGWFLVELWLRSWFLVDHCFKINDFSTKYQRWGWLRKVEAQRWINVEKLICAHWAQEVITLINMQMWLTTQEVLVVITLCPHVHTAYIQRVSPIAPQVYHNNNFLSFEDLWHLRVQPNAYDYHDYCAMVLSY